MIRPKAKGHFIRGVFGDILSNSKTLADIEYATKNDKNLKYTCLVFGTKNLRYLRSKGITCVPIHGQPKRYEWNYRHKFDFYYFGMLYFNTIVYLDWDCNPIRNIDDNFWDILSRKREIQGNLYHWSRKRKRVLANWREESYNHYIINNGFLYIRDKSIPRKLIKMWESSPNNKFWRRNDETCTSKYIDDLSGGWKGLDFWKNNFESDVCVQGVNPVFKEKSNAFFAHVNRN